MMNFEHKLLHESITNAEIAYQKLQLSHYAAMAEASKWSKRIELAQQKNRTDLALAATDREGEALQRAKRFKIQMDKQLVVLTDSRRKLAELESQTAAIKEQSSVLQCSEGNSLGKTSQSLKTAMVKKLIESLEEKIDQLAALSWEVSQDIKQLKTEILCSDGVDAFSQSAIKVEKSDSTQVVNEQNGFFKSTFTTEIDEELETLKRQLNEL